MELRKSLQVLKPYTPGKQAFGKVKMASNENPLGYSPQAAKLAQEYLNKLSLYPEGSAANLRQVLAKHLDLKPEELIIGNGSDEVIFFAASAFLNPEEEVLLADHTFSEYRFASTVLAGRVKTVELEAGWFNLDRFLEALSPKTRIIFLCSPNNPTGTIIPQENFEAFMKKVPSGVLVLLDQAYAEFMDLEDPNTYLPLVRQYPNLLITRTFSKLYGLAGLRIGYGIAHSETIQKLSVVKPPFNTSSLAQEMALAALRDQEHIKKTLALNLEGRSFFETNLGAHKLRYWPSQANFICIDLGIEASLVYQTLFDEGYIIRPLNSFGLPGCIRISFDTPEHNTACFEALLKACREHPVSLAPYYQAPKTQV